MVNFYLNFPNFFASNFSELSNSVSNNGKEGRPKSLILTGFDRLRCTASNSEHSVPFSGKRPYLNQLANNQKNKGTLLSRTLKVGENNVPSELRFVAYWLRYGCF